MNKKQTTKADLEVKLSELFKLADRIAEKSKTDKKALKMIDSASETWKRYMEYAT